MTVKNNGGQAFPGDDYPIGANGEKIGYSGMTLRDYFAAKAMQAAIGGYLANPSQDGVFDISKGDADHAAERAYKIADAMLKERGE